MTYQQLNKKLELKWLKPVMNALYPGDLINVIKRRGIAEGIAYLSFDMANEELAAVVERLYIDVGLRHARDNERRMRISIKKDFSLAFIWENFITEYLRKFLLEKITYDVAATTRDYLLKVLQRGMDEGIGIREMVKQLEELPFTKWKAAQIVRTEVNRASNVGHKAQSSTFQYEQVKEWVSGKDKRVRGNDPEDHASHVALNGTKINEDELFVDPRNGDKLEFPGDPRASAESTINCRCRVVYTGKRDENGRLIKKTKRNDLQRLQLQN
jgi:hypothetical protein